MNQPVYVHVPYLKLDSYLPHITSHKVNIELYFSAESIDTINPQKITRQTDILKENSIKVIIHGPYIDLSPGGLDKKIVAITIDRFLKTVQSAKLFSAESIVFHPGYDPFKHDSILDRWIETSAATWQTVLGFLAGENISIHLENIFDRTPDTLLALVKKIDSPQVGICLDTGHLNMFSTISLNHWIEQTAPTIKEFHLHNNWKEKDNHNSLPDGTFDFSELFSLINKHSISAKWTIETHGIEEVFKSLKYLDSI